jgi:VIT1/CCC1 family predicted Fe2+/Mn2+ transporter
MPETSVAAVNRADRVIRLGALLTILGIIFSLIAILPLVTDLQLPSIWWFLSMLTGVGLAVILLGLIISARSRRTTRARNK